jgi:hypothetical protein
VGEEASRSAKQERRRETHAGGRELTWAIDTNGEIARPSRDLSSGGAQSSARSEVRTAAAMAEIVIEPSAMRAAQRASHWETAEKANAQTSDACATRARATANRRCPMMARVSAGVR